MKGWKIPAGLSSDFLEPFHQRHETCLSGHLATPISAFLCDPLRISSKNPYGLHIINGMYQAFPLVYKYIGTTIEIRDLFLAKCKEKEHEYATERNKDYDIEDFLNDYPQYKDDIEIFIMPTLFSVN